MKWRTYLRLGRVSNLPTVWTNVLAGIVLAGGPLEPGTLAALLVALSLFYVGGMYLNDAFDRKIDARERPERPIPSGLISAREVFAIGFGMLAAAVLVLVGVTVGRAPPSNWLPVASGVALAAVITYYDAVHKRDPLSPLMMGLLSSKGPPRWHPAPEPLKAACRRVMELCQSRGVDPATLALQFVLREARLPITLVGMSSVPEVDANLKALEAPLDEGLLRDVMAILEPVKDVEWPSGNWKTTP